MNASIKNVKTTFTLVMTPEDAGAMLAGVYFESGQIIKQQSTGNFILAGPAQVEFTPVQITALVTFPEGYSLSDFESASFRREPAGFVFEIVLSKDFPS